MAGNPLFTVPIPTGGKFECFEPAKQVYLLSFESPADNRLTPDYCTSFILALDIIDHKYPRGALITTSSITKFYSNGLDFDSAIATPGFFPTYLYPLFRRLLTFPMPTIALLNGHAFAGGFMLASQHDYRIMNATRGYICLNEVDFGAVIESTLLATIRAKFAPVLRPLVLEGRRFGGPAALEAGLVDRLGGLAEAVALVQERKLVEKAQSGVFGQLREVMWKEAVEELGMGGHERGVAWRQGVDEVDRIRRHEGLARIAAWEKQGGKARL